MIVADYPNHITHDPRFECDGYGRIWHLSGAVIKYYLDRREPVPELCCERAMEKYKREQGYDA